MPVLVVWGLCWWFGDCAGGGVPVGSRRSSPGANSQEKVYKEGCPVAWPCRTWR